MVIIEMARIRVLGPRARLAATVRALQDHGTVHLIEAAPIGTLRHDLDPTAKRRRRDLTRALDGVENVLAGLQELGAAVADRSGAPPPEGKSAWLAARLAVRVDQLRARVGALADERDALRRYEPHAQIRRGRGVARRRAAHLSCTADRCRERRRGAAARGARRWHRRQPRIRCQRLAQDAPSLAR